MSDNRGLETWGQHVSLPPMRRERHFGNRVVKCFAERPGGLHQLFLNGLAANPDGEALVMGDRRITYRQLDRQIAGIAGALQSRGVARGDRVAILLPNCPEYVALVFAIARVGAVVVPLNVRETAPELEYVLNDCGACLLAHDAALAGNLPDRHATPDLAHRVTLDDVSAWAGNGAGQVYPISVDEEETALLLYTSGTTGRPKGAMLSHLAVVHSVMHYQLAMEIGPADRSILAVPISHVTGLVALVATIIGAGATLAIMPEFKAATFLDLAARERTTHTLLVPAMFNLCLLQPGIETADLSHWRIAGYGGAIMPQETCNRIATQLPSLRLMNCYGATETCSPAVLMPPVHTSARVDQVGLEVPCAEIAVMDGEGRELGADEAGEIWIAGPMVATGYWNNPEATEAEFVGGFWRSGDVGSRDALGFLRVIDRIKDVINRGGYKVFASEVENVLLGFPGVVEAAVVASPCPVLGERVHAHLVVSSVTDSVELSTYCGAHLADYKVPERFFLTDALPRNANGKVLKRMLRPAD